MKINWFDFNWFYDLMAWLQAYGQGRSERSWFFVFSDTDPGVI